MISKTVSMQMSQPVSILITTGIAALVQIATSSHTAIAQIIPDNTLPTTSEVPVGCTTCVINNGTIRGGNLFHSFTQFSIPANGSAYFNNPIEISNIISRVTGGGRSNIDGVLRANGNANLILINPNGIIFGANAQLNLGGSFLATTAENIRFADGTNFSAINSQDPLLSVSAPIGLDFSGRSNALTVNGTGHQLQLDDPIIAPTTGAGFSATGLRVSEGQTIALVGSPLNIQGGVLSAPGGKIELGSVTNGTVGLASGLVPDYTNNLSFGNIQLSRAALADASGSMSGSIRVFGDRVSVSDGSVLLMQNQGPVSASLIQVNARTSLTVSGATLTDQFPSRIVSEAVGEGNASSISIFAPELVIQNGGQISSRTYFTGNSGDLQITSNTMRLSGFANGAIPVYSFLNSGTAGLGQAGTVTVRTGSFFVDQGASLGSASVGPGQGGNVQIDASSEIFADGTIPSGFPTIFTSTVGSGNAGNLTINAARLTVINGGQVNSSTIASGNAGDVRVTANDILVKGRSPIAISFDPNLVESPEGLPSAIASGPGFDAVSRELFRLQERPSGASGNVFITAKTLQIQQDGGVFASNEFNPSPGASGSIRINADIIRFNRGIIGSPSEAGNAGSVFIRANSLQVLNQSQIGATAFSNQLGRGGRVEIDVNTLALLQGSRLGAGSQVDRGGQVAINAKSVFFSPDSVITVASGIGSTFDGTVQINTIESGVDRATIQQPSAPAPVGIQSICPAQSNPNASQFVENGTGGLPLNPSTTLTDGSGWMPQITALNRPVVPLPVTNSAVVEFQRWQFSPDGKTVELIAPSSANASRFGTSACQLSTTSEKS